MINFIYNLTGFSMAIWYICIKWTYCSKEPWLFTPINKLTSFCTIFFVLFSLFFQTKTYNNIGYIIAVFLLFRNFYYTMEDVIDYRHYPSFRQGVYVLVDIIMALFLLLWHIKYAGVSGG